MINTHFGPSPTHKQPAETAPGTRDREKAVGKTKTQTQHTHQLVADGQPLDRPAPEHIEVPERKSLHEHEAQISAVNVYLVESNGSLTRTDNTRISLYGSLFMFNHTLHIGDTQQYNIFVCMVGSVIFYICIKLFIEKKPRKINKKYISPP